MASVLTDQVLRAKQLAPVVGLVAATPKTVQFAANQGSTGNAVINVPATGRVTGNPFRVRVQGTSTLVAAGVMSIGLSLDGTQIAVVPSAGATTGTGSFSLEATVLFEAATVAVSGVHSGWYTVTSKGQTTLVANPTVDLTAEGHVLTVTANDSVTDAAAVVTLSEFSLEVL